jgi:hypothetical protein
MSDFPYAWSLLMTPPNRLACIHRRLTGAEAVRFPFLLFRLQVLKHFKFLRPPARINEEPPQPPERPTGPVRADHPRVNTTTCRKPYAIYERCAGYSAVSNATSLDSSSWRQETGCSSGVGGVHVIDSAHEYVRWCAAMTRCSIFSVPTCTALVGASSRLDW